MSDERVILGDADVRIALRSRLRAKHVLEPDTVIVEELGICRGAVRIDVAVVNGLFHGYEIKSDRDGLRRLHGQVDVYSRVLDRATLVVGPGHLAAALPIVPDWWGVLQIDSSAKKLQFKTVRKGRRNPQRDPRSLVELLWLADAIALLAQRSAARGVRHKPRRVVWDRLCEHFAVDEIAAAVRAQLKARAATPDPA